MTEEFIRMGVGLAIAFVLGVIFGIVVRSR